ncbi:hypothetical protein RHSIM_Rhsim03G0185700 [Rhododendron simsii]|uniref:ADF-H domain-containing protein n=1 Tax=Rhododendron simsii TaxID=118357 RepID=A0A834H733_RHOSS|nr:hypothetical protein RHSIM_Rhsim03G0185700 [Rhododendron simsii]
MFTVQGPHSSALFIGGVDKEANEAAKGKTEKFPQVAKLGTGSDLPYRMAVHPGGDGVICSLPKSCSAMEYDTFVHLLPTICVNRDDICIRNSTDNSSSVADDMVWQNRRSSHSKDQIWCQYLFVEEIVIDELEDVGQQLALIFNNDGSVLALGGEANAVSGMVVDDECKLKFLELKTKRNFRYIIFKIEAQKVVVEKVGSPEESYEDFSTALPADECRYSVFDFDFTTEENCQKSKIFFIAW